MAAILDQFRYAFVHRILLVLGKSKYIEYGVVYQPAVGRWCLWLAPMTRPRAAFFFPNTGGCSPKWG